MTKKDAAVQVFYVAKQIRDAMGGDEDADAWVMHLMSVVRDLDPQTERYDVAYAKWLMDDDVSVRTKLRNLIEHPGTPQPEREAALRALDRLKGAAA